MTVTSATTDPKAAKPTCFVIMPFGGHFDTYFKDVFTPAITDADLTPRRADDLFRAGDILKDIWQLTKDAAVVLADLSGRNPNVMYELGLAHAISKPVVMVTESMQDVPFDLQPHRMLVYDKNNPHWGKVLRESITKALVQTLTSPVKSVIPAFLATNPEVAVPATEKELLGLRRDVDALIREIYGAPSRETLLRHGPPPSSISPTGQVFADPRFGQQFGIPPMKNEIE